MTITVQQIFDQAIHLMDEQNEVNGGTMTVDTSEYKSRTISILNTAIPRLYPYSSNYDRTATGRPAAKILDGGDYANPDFTQVIMLDDDMCLGLLPFYLAAHLLSGENESLAAWFMAQYRECLADFKRNIPATFEQIPTPYGTF
jgi:hypothetical protein